MYKQFENTQGVISSRKTRDKQYNGKKKNKQWPTKHYT